MISAYGPSLSLARRYCQAGVIIPVYNRATIILATLESVARQSRLPMRVVVVDDGSTDDSAGAVDRWVRSTAPPFETRLLRKQHETAAIARNRGLGDVEPLPLVAFLDSDDRWPPDFLDRTAAALEADAGAVAATVDRRYLDVAGHVLRSDDCRALAGDPIPWFFRHGGGVASSTLLRTTAVRAAGAWSPTLGSTEDAMLFIHTSLHGRWLHVPGAPVAFHHDNAAARNEEGNLSHRHSDSLRRWARAYEQIYASLDGRYPASRRKQLRASVAAYWYRAGKQLNSLGQAAAARDCYSRALSWSPIMFRAWRRRLSSQLASIAGSRRWRTTVLPSASA